MSNKLEDYGKELEKSHELAFQLEQMKMVIHQMDMDYVKETADKLVSQGNFQDSAAVLMPSNPLEKNDLLRTMGKSLHKLCEFVELLKKCDEGKAAVRDAEASRDKIAKLFM